MPTDGRYGRMTLEFNLQASGKTRIALQSGHVISTGSINGARHFIKKKRQKRELDLSRNTTRVK